MKIVSPLLLLSKMNKYFIFPSGHIQNIDHSVKLYDSNNFISQKKNGIIECLRPHNIPPLILINSLSSYLQYNNFNHLFTYNFLNINLISSLLTTGSCLLNDCMDKNVDIINKPESPIASNLISLKEGYFISSLFFGLAYYISLKSNSVISFITKQNAFLLLLYTPFFKKITFLKNIVCCIIIANTTLLSANTNIILNSDIFTNWLKIFQSVNHYVKLLYLSLFSICMYKEINYDIRDMKGDKNMQIYTIPVVFGRNISFYLMSLFKKIGFGSLFLLFILRLGLVLQ